LTTVPTIDSRSIGLTRMLDSLAHTAQRCAVYIRADEAHASINRLRIDLELHTA
jgi:hypothetical protein